MRTPTDLTRIGDSLLYLRNYAGLIQAEMAARLGIKPQALSLFELNKCLPKSSFLEKVVKVTGCTAKWLLTGTGEIFQPGTARGKPRVHVIDLAERIQGDQVLSELFDLLTKKPELTEHLLKQANLWQKISSKGGES